MSGAASPNALSNEYPGKAAGTAKGQGGPALADFGDHRRNILAGMKQEREDPSVIIGKQALFVVNLSARKMRGEISEGMLFDIGYADGVLPVLAVPESVVPNGTRAG